MHYTWYSATDQLVLQKSVPFLSWEKLPFELLATAIQVLLTTTMGLEPSTLNIQCATRPIYAPNLTTIALGNVLLIRREMIIEISSKHSFTKPKNILA